MGGVGWLTSCATLAESLSQPNNPHLYPCHICQKHLYAASHRNVYHLSEILVSTLKDLSFVGHLILHFFQFLLDIYTVVSVRVTGELDIQ